MIQMRQDCSIEIGNERKVRFWEDVWCEEAPLCSSFPSLYEVASSKGAKVEEMWEVIRTGGGWNFIFERHFNNWELEETHRFICIVSTKSLSPLSNEGSSEIGQRTLCSQSSLVMTFWKEGGNN